MKKWLWVLLMLGLWQWVLMGEVWAGSRIYIALQPFEKLDKELLDHVVQGIKKEYGDVHIEIQTQIPLPTQAYYAPRNRYRADELLDFLREYYVSHKLSKYTKIIGLLTKDISTTKGSYYDWGIFGSAYLDSGPGVISTFRLKRKAKSQQHFLERMNKVVIHELGHTFGFDHCPVAACVMADAQGTIKTVDEGKETFCGLCRPKLDVILKKYQY
jgi:archaemetzincin